MNVVSDCEDVTYILGLFYIQPLLRWPYSGIRVYQMYQISEPPCWIDLLAIWMAYTRTNIAFILRTLR